MALEFQNNAEGGSNGTAVTTGNSGGVSGDAWTSVAAGTGNTVTFDSSTVAHGSLSYKAVIGTTNTCILQKTVTGTGRYVMEFGFRFSTVPTAGGTRFFEIRNSTGAMGSLGILPTTGTVRAYNAAGSNIAASESSALSVNTWYRVAFAVTPGADTATGTIEYSLYAGDSTTALWSWTSAAQNTGTTAANFIRIGTPAVLSTANTFWYDDVRASSLASGFFGPVATATTYSGSGTATSTSAATGAPTSLLVAAGSAASASAAAGLIAALLVSGGQAAATSAATGSATARLTSTGSATSAASATGAPTALLGSAGSVSSTSTASGSPAVIVAPKVYSASGTAASATTATGDPSGLLGVSGSAASVSTTTGIARIDRDVTLVSLTEVTRPLAVSEVARPLTVGEIVRPLTASLAEGVVMQLNVNAREFYQLTIVTDPPVDGWEASFDDGVTWVAGEPVIRIANTWRWLVSGPEFVGDATPSTTLASVGAPLIRAVDAPEVVVHRAPSIYLKR
jgi:hypothetical protein